MRAARLVLLAAAVSLPLAGAAFSCGGGKASPRTDVTTDAAADQTSATISACLDRPTIDPLRPPSTTLPCELIPPGLQL